MCPVMRSKISTSYVDENVDYIQFPCGSSSDGLLCILSVIVARKQKNSD